MRCCLVAGGRAELQVGSLLESETGAALPEDFVLVQTLTAMGMLHR